MGYDLFQNIFVIFLTSALVVRMNGLIVFTNANIGTGSKKYGQLLNMRSRYNLYEIILLEEYMR